MATLSDWTNLNNVPFHLWAVTSAGLRSALLVNFNGVTYMVGLMGFNVEYSQAQKYAGKTWNTSGAGDISQDEFISGIKFTASAAPSCTLYTKSKPEGESFPIQIPATTPTIETEYHCKETDGILTSILWDSTTPHLMSGTSGIFANASYTPSSTPNWSVDSTPPTPSSGSNSNTTTSSQTTLIIVIVIVGLVLLAGVFLWLKYRRSLEEEEDEEDEKGEKDEESGEEQEDAADDTQ